MLLSVACGNSSKQGPAEIVESFTQAVAAGRFDEAAGQCSEEVAIDYVKAYEKAMSAEFKADSTATLIAARIMADVKVNVTEVSKGKGSRTVFYTIEDAYGDRKDKIAIVRKVEGEWKVTEIRDRN